jgi:chromosome segregation ATPase
MDKAAIAHDLNNHGIMDLAKDVSKDKYTPPADGKLSDAQVQMYLKVREHEKQIAQVAKDQLKQHADEAKKDGEKSVAGMMEGLKAMGSATDFLTADIRAAKDLHYNTQEYLWVKGQILAASTSVLTEKMQQASGAAMDQAYTQLKKSYDEAKDDQTRQIYKTQLDAYEKQREEMKKQEPQPDSALAYNRQLLSKYENALNAYTNELSKYEDKPGEAQKSMDELQKNLEKAKTGR